MIDVKFHWSRASWIRSILTETQRSMDTLESVKHSLTTIVAFFSLEFVVSCWPLTRTKNCAVLIRNINTIALIFSHKSDPKGPKYELPERNKRENFMSLLCLKGTQRIYFEIDTLETSTLLHSFSAINRTRKVQNMSYLKETREKILWAYFVLKVHREFIFASCVHGKA